MEDKRKIAIACDHGGYSLKLTLIKHLESHGFIILDLGTNGTDSVDYPEYAHKVARNISSNQSDIGILICGTGIGMEMAANKHTGIRAANCTNTTMAKLTRQHNNANVLCLGARIVGEVLAIEILDTFLHTDFEGGRHTRRVEMIDTQI